MTKSKYREVIEITVEEEVHLLYPLGSQRQWRPAQRGSTMTTEDFIVAHKASGTRGIYDLPKIVPGLHIGLHIDHLDADGEYRGGRSTPMVHRPGRFTMDMVVDSVQAILDAVIR